MSTGLAALALFTPAIASNAIFSVRRASRGVDAIDENPIYGLANLNIAAGQILKGGRAVKAAAIISNPKFEQTTKGAAETIKNLSKTSKVANGFSKVLNFTANNINPVICVTSGIKVLGSEDKVDTLARESLALTTMFGAEAAAKSILGLPYTKNGKTIARSPLFERQLKAMCDYQNLKQAFNNKAQTCKWLKYAPGAAKGLLFALASIAGYKVGAGIANKVLGEPKETKKTEEKTN